MKITIVIILILLQVGSAQSQSDIDAQEIVNRSIAFHGGDSYNDMHYSMDFRKYHLDVRYENGVFSYERSYLDKNNIPIKSVFANTGLSHFINEEKSKIDKKQVDGIRESINSQVYFALLPYHLNDGAVIKVLDGESVIEGKKYHRLIVTFNQEGGGQDFEDTFIYWIDQSDFSMDFLAYQFHVNKGGYRFRKAYNTRRVGDIIFQDYVNYAPTKTLSDVRELESLYVTGQLKELSKIELKDIKNLR